MPAKTRGIPRRLAGTQKENYVHTRARLANHSLHSTEQTQPRLV
jgi:hypothetical protein